MQADLPRIKYSKSKKVSDQPYTKEDYDEAVIANDEIYQRYLVRMAEEKGQEINLTELMQA